MRSFWGFIIWIAATLALIWAPRLSSESGADPHAGSVHAVTNEETVDAPSMLDPSSLLVNDRIQYLTERGVYSCATQCHDRIVTNPNKREHVAVHDSVHLKHGDLMWCFNCHSQDNRDSLVLIDGSEIGFNESHRLCGQCHGLVYRDWLHGAHGQRTGYWNGEKSAWPCTRCHYPHDPAFKPMTPRPPPKTRFDR